MGKDSKASSDILIPLLIILVTLVLGFGPNIWRYYKAQRVVKEGIPATAIIKALEDTGNRYNNNPEVKLTLEVTPDNGHTYQTQITTVVSVVALSGYQPGTTVRIKYDPKHPNNVVLIGHKGNKSP